MEEKTYDITIYFSSNVTFNVVASDWDATDHYLRCIDKDTGKNKIYGGQSIKWVVRER